MTSPPSILSTASKQGQYIRARDNPFFDGMRRGDASMMDKESLFYFPGKTRRPEIPGSASYISGLGPREIFTGITDNADYGPLTDSQSDIITDPFSWSLSGSLSKTKITSGQIPETQSELGLSFEDDKKLEAVSSPGDSEENEQFYAQSAQVRPSTERSYSLTYRRLNLGRISLPPCAASFYDGNLPPIEVVESCESINRLNMYLKATKDEVKACVPGRFLHAVIGQDVYDVGSFVSTLIYSFYLSETLKSCQFCTVPVINMKRADLNSHAELKWLLDSCDIDQSSLVFFDEIDLSYYDLFGSLKLVLVNGDKLPYKHEALKESLVEIFNCKKGDLAYPWVETVTMEQDCSCCALIAEKFAMTSPEVLAGKQFSRLLLAGILLDTGNLSSPNCTSKDKYMSTLLINGAGRFGCNGLYQILKYKMYDVSDLKVEDILRKDFRKWTKIGKPDSSASSRLMVSHVGMSTIGISIAQFLSHFEASNQEIMHFQQLEKLRLFMIVSSYYDSQKNFKREILVSAESAELVKDLHHFFDLQASHLPLKVFNQPGLRDEMRAFKIDKVTSRRTIERLLEEFCGGSKS